MIFLLFGRYRIWLPLESVFDGDIIDARFHLHCFTQRLTEECGRPTLGILGLFGEDDAQEIFVQFFL